MFRPDEDLKKKSKPIHFYFLNTYSCFDAKGGLLIRHPILILLLLHVWLRKSPWGWTYVDRNMLTFVNNQAVLTIIKCSLIFCILNENGIWKYLAKYTTNT